MLKFDYYAPTNILFGKDRELEVGKLLIAQKSKKVLIHFGGNSAKASGLLEKVYHSLDKEGISYISLGGVVPNPRLSKVYEGIELCKSQGVDFILAVGGGSVIDSAKAIGYGVVNDYDVWDLYEKKRKPTGCLPIGAIVTMAATGSEMSDSSVITNEINGLKRGCNSNYCRCKFAILNPELTYTLPNYQTASGCADILMHTMERYFKKEKDTELIDSIAESLMKTVIHNTPIALKNPTNYTARAQIMWASSLSHNDLTGDRSMGDWSCHQLEHELSGMFDVTHGAGLTAIWGSWARYVYKADIIRFAKFAVNVLQIPNDFVSLEQTALAGIEAMELFYHSIGMPTSIHGLGIDLTEEQIEELAYKCSFGNKRAIGIIRILTKEDMKAIYRMAK